MKINITSIVIALCSLLFASGCYEDKSTLPTNPIDQVDISLEGENESTLRVDYLGQLDITPTYKQGSDAQPEGLEYEWAMTDLPNKEEYSIISTEPELHHVVSHAIASQPYWLRLTVTDTKNEDLKYVKAWQVYVQSAFLDGLVVSDTKDATTSDLTLILNKNLTVNYTREERIFRDIITTATGSPFPKKLSSLTYGLAGSYTGTHTNYLWTISDDKSLGQFNMKNLVFRATEKLMSYRPEGIEFNKIFQTDQWLIHYTNKGMYGMSTTNDGLLTWPNATLSSSVINNNVVCAHPKSNPDASYAVAMWLDKQAGRLQFISYASFQVAMGTIELDPNKTYAYDPNNLGDKSAVAAGLTTNGKIPAILLKDDATGNYAIYTVTPHVSAVEIGTDTDGDGWDDEWETISPEIPLAPRALYPIPASGKALIDNASSVFFCNNESIMYVATADGIYAINFSGSSATLDAAPKFSSPNGERISSAKLYQQGIFTYEQRLCEPTTDWEGNPIPSACPMLELTNKAVIITTQKTDTEGYVYVVPMVRLGTGDLDAGKALRYGGFGKILDVVTTGY